MGWGLLIPSGVELQVGGATRTFPAVGTWMPGAGVERPSERHIVQPRSSSALITTVRNQRSQLLQILVSEVGC